MNPEEAKTLTAGFVWSPNTQYEQVNGLNLTIDYYDIKITDMISVEGAYTVYEKCLSPSSNPDLQRSASGVSQDQSQPGDRHRNDDDRVLRQRGVRGSGGCRSHGGLAHGSRGRHVRRELHDLAATGRDDAGHGAGRGDRLEGQPWSHRQHVAEQRRLRLSNVHDVQLRDAATGTCRCVGGICRRRSMLLRRPSTPTSRPACFRPPRPPRRCSVPRARTTCSILSGTFDVGQRTPACASAWTICSTRTPVCTGGRTAADPHPAPCGGETEAGFYDVMGRSLYAGVKRHLLNAALGAC